MKLLAPIALSAVLLISGCGISGGDKANESAGTPTTASAEPAERTETTSTAGADAADTPETTGRRATTTTTTGGMSPGILRETFVAGMAASLMDASSFQASRSEAECVAGAVADSFSLERLTEIAEDGDSGFETMSLSETEANSIYDAFGGCGISLRDKMLEGMDGGTFGEDGVRCLEQLIDDEFTREIMVAGFMGDDVATTDAMSRFEDDLFACVLGSY